MKIKSLKWNECNTGYSNKYLLSDVFFINLYFRIVQINIHKFKVDLCNIGNCILELGIYDDIKKAKERTRRFYTNRIKELVK